MLRLSARRFLCSSAPLSPSSFVKASAAPSSAASASSDAAATRRPVVLINGVSCAAKMQAKLKRTVSVLHSSHLLHLDDPEAASWCAMCEDLAHRGANHKARSRPSLVTVRVSDSSPPTDVYVMRKHRAATECGFESRILVLPADITQDELEREMSQLSADATVHGILLQRPLPPHLSAVAATARIAPLKDVDGLHPTNVGMLHTRGKFPVHAPCTAVACIKLLMAYHIPIAGRNAVVLGNSNIIGRPMAELLLGAGASVATIPGVKLPPSDEASASSSSSSSPHDALFYDADMARQVVQTADIVIAALGQREVVRGSWIKPGAAVLDVGLTPVLDATKANGFRLVGDVHFEECARQAGYITPVPGGVGPVTVAVLMENTLRAWQAICVAGLDPMTDASKAAQLLWPPGEPKYYRY